MRSLIIFPLFSWNSTLFLAPFINNYILIDFFSGREKSGRFFVGGNAKEKYLSTA